MNTAFDVLVITLSVLLGLFLILSIVIGVLVLKLVQSIKRVVAKGEQVIDTAESAAEMFKHAAGPLGILKTVANIVETVGKHKSKKGE